MPFFHAMTEAVIDRADVAEACRSVLTHVRPELEDIGFVLVYESVTALDRTALGHRIAARHNYRLGADGPLVEVRSCLSCSGEGRNFGLCEARLELRRVDDNPHAAGPETLLADIHLTASMTEHTGLDMKLPDSAAIEATVSLFLEVLAERLAQWERGSFARIAGEALQS